MVPTKLIFWSNSRKESLKSQQKHALKNRFLQTLLCPDDTFNPGYNWKMLNRKKTCILDDVCYIYEQLFLPGQCTACKKCQSSSTNKLVLSKAPGVLSTFNPGYNWKKLNRTKTCILDDVCYTYEQLFHPVQCTACKRCQGSSTDKLVLSRALGVLSTLNQIHYL